MKAQRSIQRRTTVVGSGISEESVEMVSVPVGEGTTQETRDQGRQIMKAFVHDLERGMDWNDRREDILAWASQARSDWSRPQPPSPREDMAWYGRLAEFEIRTIDAALAQGAYGAAVRRAFELGRLFEEALLKQKADEDYVRGQRNREATQAGGRATAKGDPKQRIAMVQGYIDEGHSVRRAQKLTAEALTKQGLGVSKDAVRYTWDKHHRSKVAGATS